MDMFEFNDHDDDDFQELWGQSNRRVFERDEDPLTEFSDC